jgi:hypothetical protein
MKQSLERQKGKDKEHGDRGSGIAAEPPHRSFREIGGPDRSWWWKKQGQNLFVWQAMKEGCWAESKDLLEPERMKAVENMQSYQNETKLGDTKW